MLVLMGEFSPDIGLVTAVLGCRAEQQRQPCLVHLLLLGCGLNVNLAPGYSWVPASIGSSFSLALIRRLEMFLPHSWQSMVFEKIFSLHVYHIFNDVPVF